MSGKLYLVATPIGNLDDITLRAIETLRSVDLIACEDTRHTQKLLNRFDIRKKLMSYHEHNEASRAEELIQILKEGLSVALVSDAGTPTISDPGYRLLRMAVDHDVDIVPIPGPSALITAISASGVPTDSFFFAGFLPARKGDRQRRLRELAALPATLVFYEAPHRLQASLADCLSELGDRYAVVARELTKMHERFLRGNISELIRVIIGTTVKGEIVLVIDRDRRTGKPVLDVGNLAARVSELTSSGLDPRAALKQAAKEFGISRSEAYRELQIAKNS